MRTFVKLLPALASISVIVGWVLVVSTTVHAQSPTIAEQLRSLKKTAVVQLRQYVDIVRSVRGRDHPDYVDALTKLGRALAEIDDNREAIRTLSEALARAERLYGEHDKRLLDIINPLFGSHFRQGAFDEAARLGARALKIARNAYPADHKVIGVWLNNLGLADTSLGRFSSAERRLKEAVEITERRPGDPSPLFAIDLDNLAEVYRLTGRFAKALELKKRAVGLIVRSPLPAHRMASISVLSNLATLYRDMGDLDAAEARQRQAIAISEHYLGPNALKTAELQVALGALYWQFGRLDEAEALFKQAIERSERVLGKDHVRIAVALNNLAQVYQAQHKLSSAEPLMRRALSIVETALGATHHEIATYLSNLGLLLDDMGRPKEAEPLIKRAISVNEGSFDADHPVLIPPLINLADLKKTHGDLEGATPIYQRAARIAEAALGSTHPITARSWAKLARLYMTRKDWTAAHAFSRKAGAATVARVAQLRSSPRFTGTELGRTGIIDTKRILNDGVRIAFRVASANPGDRLELRNAAFVNAQWAQATSAATALSQMAARIGAGGGKLAELVRSRQDFVAQWQTADRALAAAILLPSDKRNPALERRHRETRKRAASRITAVERNLARLYPSFARLANPVPLSLREVQSLLRPDEALVLFHDVPKTDELAAATMVWAITKTETRWAESPVGGAALKREVDVLRCGLDEAAWHDGGAAHCASVLGMSALAPGLLTRPLPFPLSRAHQIYGQLFSDIRGLVQDRKLLVVASGALTRLPFQVLVAKPPQGEAFGDAHWLIRDHAITVLPAVSSLLALRKLARASHGRKVMIGIGNPLLDGDQANPSHGAQIKRQAALARQKQRCKTSIIQRFAALVGLSRNVAPIAMRDGLADQNHLKAQMPLPETADELCAVARALGADPQDVLLGARASESAIKQLSSNGQLSQYRILHFATHGALAGQLTGTNEPGLILTPPRNASSRDDGYLTASEIAELKLDADWIILSACNTAAGAANNESAEALSGLARSFFYAGGRSLLVSHWEVNSNAAVTLVTDAVKAISNDKGVGRAEALRRAMLAILKDGGARKRHPSYWAPFVVVGEGSAVR